MFCQRTANANATFLCLNRKTSSNIWINSTRSTGPNWIWRNLQASWKPAHLGLKKRLWRITSIFHTFFQWLLRFSPHITWLNPKVWVVSQFLVKACDSLRCVRLSVDPSICPSVCLSARMFVGWLNWHCVVMCVLYSNVCTGVNMVYDEMYA